MEFAEFSEDEINILGFGEDANEVWFLAYEDGRKAVFRADHENRIKNRVHSFKNMKIIMKD